MISETDYLQYIQQTFPGLALRAVKINRDGMVNVSVIVNQERVFRFPRAGIGDPAADFCTMANNFDNQTIRNQHASISSLR